MTGRSITRDEASMLIAGLTRTRRRTLVTLDGPCAGGKTTLAARLAGETGGTVVHTDHFVVPLGQKTPERLAVPGGNCDRERLENEVLRPWKEGTGGFFRRYSWTEDRLLEPEALPGDGLMILEGSYCSLPELRQYADLRLFMDTPEDIRMARLKERETPASFARFLEKWIPLEKAYFEAYGLPDPDCLLVR